MQARPCRAAVTRSLTCRTPAQQRAEAGVRERRKEREMRAAFNTHKNAAGNPAFRSFRLLLTLPHPLYPTPLSSPLAPTSARWRVGRLHCVRHAAGAASCGLQHVQHGTCSSHAEGHAPRSGVSVHDIFFSRGFVLGGALVNSLRVGVGGGREKWVTSPNTY